MLDEWRAGVKEMDRWTEPQASEGGTTGDFTRIERAYGGREAWQKAREDGRTHLDYRQWVQVRTPAFKRWFGDWEALRAQQRLDTMEPVRVEIPAEWEHSSKDELRQRVADALNAAVLAKTEIIHPELGPIRISRKGERKTISASPDPAKLLIANALDRVIPASVVGEIMPGEKQGVDARENLLARVRVGDTELVAIIALNRQTDGRWYYNTVAVTDGKKGNGPRVQASPGAVASPLGETPLTRAVADFIRRPLDRVNPDTVSKVIHQDTGEPLVVYHGTDADIDAFDPERRGHITSNNKESYKTFSFASAPDIANFYARQAGRIHHNRPLPIAQKHYPGQEPLTGYGGENLMPVFLSLRDPLIARWNAENSVSATTDRAISEERDGVVMGNIGHPEVGLQIGDVYLAFHPEQIKSAISNRGTFDPENSVLMASEGGRGGAADIPAPDPDKFELTDKQILEDPPVMREPGDRHWLGDISWFSKLFIHPRMQASLQSTFVPVYRVGEQQVEDRDQIAHELAQRIEGYFSLPEESKTRVNAVLELDRLAEKVHLAGKEMVVKNEGQRLARLSKPGETITLTDVEKTAYWHVRRMLDVALKMFRDQLLAELGVDAARFKGGDIAAQILDAINPAMTEEQKQNHERAAKFAHEIEQARRRGYVPFTRWGNVVVAVKDPKGKVLWAEKIEVDPVEFHRAGVAVRALRELREMPSVARALEHVRTQFKGESVEISAFQIPEGMAPAATHPDIGQLDALAQVAGLEPAEWDGVRAKLEAAIKAKGFRKHFLGSGNVPGYSGDFERAIADYVTGMAGYLARRKHREAWDEAIAGIPAVKRRLRDYASKYRDYMQSPQEELHLLRQIGFIYYLGMIPASAIANLTQVPLVSAPYLAQFVNAGVVARELERAGIDAAKMYKPADTGFEMFDPALAPEDIREALQDAPSPFRFSAVRSRGLIEASGTRLGDGRAAKFSAVRSRGLIEAGVRSRSLRPNGNSFRAQRRRLRRGRHVRGASPNIAASAAISSRPGTSVCSGSGSSSRNARRSRASPSATA
ncbi:MAG: ADP-ribosyltransferase-containing protein [Betaproteobacteria bacterium]